MCTRQVLNSLISIKMAAAVQFWYSIIRQNGIKIALNLLNIHNNQWQINGTLIFLNSVVDMFQIQDEDLSGGPKPLL